jgi:hypothetical protein
VHEAEVRVPTAGVVARDGYPEAGGAQAGGDRLGLEPRRPALQLDDAPGEVPLGIGRLVDTRILVALEELGREIHGLFPRERRG